MGRGVRISKVDGAALADCMYLIGRAQVKIADGDAAGGNEDLAAARRLVPPGGVEEVMRAIGDGELPAPGTGPDAVDAWLEACRMAGAGDIALVQYFFPSAAELAKEEREAFLGRLEELRADAERRMAAGELGPPPEMPPVRPPPWEDDSLKGLNEPGSLSESLRRMGLM